MASTCAAGLRRVLRCSGRTSLLGSLRIIAMQIRPYQPGDERAQSEIYNAAAGRLPGFKPATVDEVVRRDRANAPDPTSRFYAVEDGDIIGYTLLNPSGRISHPWCVPEAQDARPALLETALSALAGRGRGEAWAAYRADWEPVLRFFRESGFVVAREMINYIAEVARLPRISVPP